MPIFTFSVTQLSPVSLSFNLIIMMPFNKCYILFIKYLLLVCDTSAVVQSEEKML